MKQLDLSEGLKSPVKPVWVEAYAFELLARNDGNQYAMVDVPRVLGQRWINSYDLARAFGVYDIRKAVAIGALRRERLGPRKGWRYQVVSEEAWEKLVAWRAALALGVRSVRDDKLK